MQTIMIAGEMQELAEGYVVSGLFGEAADSAVIAACERLSVLHGVGSTVTTGFGYDAPSPSVEPSIVVTIAVRDYEHVGLVVNELSEARRVSGEQSALIIVMQGHIGAV